MRPWPESRGAKVAPATGVAGPTPDSPAGGHARGALQWSTEKVTLHPPDQQQQRPRRSGERVVQYAPLLIAVFVAAHTAVLAISMTTDEPKYELALHTSLTLGVVASFVAVATGWSFSFVGTAVMVFSFAAYALRFRVGLPLISLLYPPEVVGDEETGLAALVGWFLVGFVFMQSQRENLVFILVPGLTIFALMATRNVNPELLVAFMVFLLATVYCWGYDHFLKTTANYRRSVDWWQWARVHVSGAALVFALAGLGGTLLGLGLYYTTPRLYAGFGFQQRIWNWAGAHVQGYFLFRNGFQLSGGPVRLSPNPVLKVKASKAALWRGRSYDTYDGQGWSRKYGEQRSVVSSAARTYEVRRVQPPRRPEVAPEWGAVVPGGASAPRAGPSAAAGGGQGSDRKGALAGQQTVIPGAREPVRIFTPGQGFKLAQGPAFVPAPRAPNEPGAPPELWEQEPLRGAELVQEVEVLGAATTALFAAAHPYRLQLGPAVGFVDPIRGGGVHRDVYGSLQAPTMMEPGQTYTVWSKLPEFNPDQLRSAPRKQYDPAFKAQYIEQVPVDVAVELKPIVQEITAGAHTDYDRVQAILEYLERRCLYTLDVPYTPAGRDPVVHFVKTTRRGACDLFASALTLMCRLAGVPARVATGFSAGQYDAEQDAFIVRGTDAHAWSEVYFPGYGWVPFDPAAMRSLERQSLVSLLRMGEWRLALGGLARGLLLLGAVLVGLYMAATALIDPLALLRAALRRRIAAREPLWALAHDYQALLRLLARRARLAPRPGWTPCEITEAALASAALCVTPDQAQTLRSLAADFYRLRYGRSQPEHRIARLRARISRVHRQLRGLKPLSQARCLSVPKH